MILLAFWFIRDHGGIQTGIQTLLNHIKYHSTIFMDIIRVIDSFTNI
jgi:hypothetical protein